MSACCSGFVPDTSSGGGGGSSGSVTTFQYTVTGAEPGFPTDTFTIPLPAARASANYGVQVTQADYTNLLASAVPNAGRTINDFVLELSGNATIGDVFTFTVSDL